MSSWSCASGGHHQGFVFKPTWHARPVAVPVKQTYYWFHSTYEPACFGIGIPVPRSCGREKSICEAVALYRSPPDPHVLEVEVVLAVALWAFDS